VVKIIFSLFGVAVIRYGLQNINWKCLEASSNPMGIAKIWQFSGKKE